MQRRSALALPKENVTQPSTEGLVDILKKLITGAPEHQTAAERRKLSDYTGHAIRQIKETYLNDQWLAGKTLETNPIPDNEITAYTWYAKSDDPLASLEYLLKVLRQFMTDFSRTMRPFATAVGKQTLQVRNSQTQFAAQTFEKIYPIVMGIPVPRVTTPVMLGGYTYKPGDDGFEASEAWLKRHTNQAQIPPKRQTLPALDVAQVKKLAAGIVALLEEAQRLSGVVYNNTPFVDVEDGGWNSEQIHNDNKLDAFINHVDQPTAMGEWHNGMVILSAIAFEKWCALSVK